MFEHCTKHRPAAEVIYMAGNRCPICAELTRLRERIVELENLNRSIDQEARVVMEYEAMPEGWLAFLEQVEAVGLKASRLAKPEEPR